MLTIGLEERLDGLVQQIAEKQFIRLLDQELIAYHYSSCSSSWWGDRSSKTSTSFKKPMTPTDQTGVNENINV